MADNLREFGKRPEVPATKQELIMTDEELTVRIGDATLQANLKAPEGATCVVLFAHGSGSSRHSPRNRHVARMLQQARIATLLLDLLTEEEETVDRERAHLRYNIPLLTDRLVEVTGWVEQHPELGQRPIGYFGASTGAAAALMAAARRPDLIGAVVSRGGRPDLAGDALFRVRAPTLLIVGRLDPWVLELNREAMDKMSCEKRLDIIPNATHLFEEPGALDQVAGLARDWFRQHLGGLQKGTRVA
jgi:putative phosphoribosyl transferase